MSMLLVKCSESVGETQTPIGDTVMKEKRIGMIVNVEQAITTGLSIHVLWYVSTRSIKSLSEN
jgi:hypothetical protein